MHTCPPFHAFHGTAPPRMLPRQRARMSAHAHPEEHGQKWHPLAQPCLECCCGNTTPTHALPDPHRWAPPSARWRRRLGRTRATWRCPLTSGPCWWPPTSTPCCRSVGSGLGVSWFRLTQTVAFYMDTMLQASPPKSSISRDACLTPVAVGSRLSINAGRDFHSLGGSRNEPFLLAMLPVACTDPDAAARGSGDPAARGV